MSRFREEILRAYDQIGRDRIWRAIHETEPTSWARANPDLGMKPEGWARGPYQPTAGMLRALSGAAGATPMDAVACRLRGLMDRHGAPTSEGAAVIARETKRQKGEWPRG